jgi:hypothetical protein
LTVVELTAGLLALLSSGCAVVAELDEFRRGEGAGGDGTGGGGGPSCADGPILTEVRLRGPDGGGDELVEITNAGSVSVDLGTLSLAGKPTPGGDFMTKWVGPRGAVLGPDERIVLSGASAEPFGELDSMGDDQVIVLRQGDGTVEGRLLDTISICCERCDEFPSNAAPIVFCGDESPISLQRAVECAGEPFVPGPSTPDEPFTP